MPGNLLGQRMLELVLYSSTGALALRFVYLSVFNSSVMVIGLKSKYIQSFGKAHGRRTALVELSQPRQQSSSLFQFINHHKPFQNQESEVNFTRPSGKEPTFVYQK